MVKTRTSDNSASAHPSTSAPPTTLAHSITLAQPTVVAQPPGAPVPPPSLSILSTLEDDISKLSEEGKTIVSIIIKAMQAMSDKKDQVINQLQNKVIVLESKLCDLENLIDDVNQYERRDTLIVSGASLPKETSNENSAEVFISAVKDNLRINISHTDINVAHRIGNSTQQNASKPIIVKLHSRLKKQEIINACITIRPNLHINESLTPKRLALFKTVWSIRKDNRDLFQQCYTKDGKIYVKLRCSNQKHIITNEQNLNNFLDKFPTFRGNV